MPGAPRRPAAFLKEARWHLDLVRRCDGSFTLRRRGAVRSRPDRRRHLLRREQLLRAESERTYVLTYALPLKRLASRARKRTRRHWLGRKDVEEAIASGRFDVDRKTRSTRRS